jgi:hypothetical protein
MCGTMPPPPQCVFMVWCLVKHRDNFTFNFNILHRKKQVRIFRLKRNLSFIMNNKTCLKRKVGSINLHNSVAVICSYQYGPDTYLLQLRDVDFPVRLREYMKVAANRGPVVGVHDNYDWRVCITKFVESQKLFSPHQKCKENNVHFLLLTGISVFCLYFKLNYIVYPSYDLDTSLQLFYQKFRQHSYNTL